MPTTADAISYLTFSLGAEAFAVRAERIEVILGSVPVTKVPRGPAHVRGVFNQRGRIVPLVDLGAVLGVSSGAGDRRCTIVVRAGPAGREPGLLGLEVDDVREVVGVRSSEVQPSPRTRGVEGLVEIRGALTLLLDVDRVLDAGEIGDLSS